MAAKSKGSPPKPAAAIQIATTAAPASAVQPAGEGRFNVKGIARIFAIVAMILLMSDVVLNHQHSITLCFWAACSLTVSMLLNLIGVYYIYTGGSSDDKEHARISSSAWLGDAAAIANLIALDMFLYEETSYNHWGHSENVLKEERLGGAFVELAIAMWIFYNITKHQTLDEAVLAKQQGVSMV